MSPRDALESTASIDAGHATAREQAYLVSRGVRALALVGACPATDESIAAASGLLLTAGQHFDGVQPFVIRRSDGTIDYGYAAEAWVVDLFRWAREAPAEHEAAILGLLLGYSPPAIARHLETARSRAADEVLL